MEFEDRKGTLRAAKPPSRMSQKNGIWVMSAAGKTITLEETNGVLQNIRDQRDHNNFSPGDGNPA